MPCGELNLSISIGAALIDHRPLLSRKNSPAIDSVRTVIRDELVDKENPEVDRSQNGAFSSHPGTSARPMWREKPKLPDISLV